MLLQKGFYESNKNRVLRSMFPAELADLYDTIVAAHKNYDKDISTQEVRELFKVHNPTITRAKYEVVVGLLNDIHKLASISSDVAKDVLQKMCNKRLAEI